MPSQPPSMKETRAFKIGARARKFAIEGCIIEGYEILYTAIAESESADPQLHALLKVEFEKYERRVAAMEMESEIDAVQDLSRPPGRAEDDIE